MHLVTVLAPLLEAASGAGGPAGPGGPMGGCGGGQTTQMLIMMGLVFAIFYFLIIRPSQKRERDRQAMLSGLKPGDEVVTNGGIVGRITGTAEKHLVVEISPKVRVKVLRAQVSRFDDSSDKDGSGPSKKGKGGGKGDKGKGRRDEGATDDTTKSDEKESSS